MTAIAFGADLESRAGVVVSRDAHHFRRDVDPERVDALFGEESGHGHRNRAPRSASSPSPWWNRGHPPDTPRATHGLGTGGRVSRWLALDTSRRSGTGPPACVPRATRRAGARRVRLLRGRWRTAAAPPCGGSSSSAHADGQKRGTPTRAPGRGRRSRLLPRRSGATIRRRSGGFSPRREGR